MKITPSEIADWRENPTTQKIFTYLKKRRNEEMEAMAEGAYTFPDADATAQKMASVIGGCMAFKEILDISYEDFVHEYNLTEEEDGVE